MKSKYPLVGIPIDDLIAALTVAASSPDMGEARVLQVEVGHDGHILVKTGVRAGPRSGGGGSMLLRKTEAAWEVAWIGGWRS